MSQLSTDMQKFLRQEFGIEAESFLTDTAKEYRVEITEFRKHINSYCDDLISRADSSLKANQKVATKKKLRDVCRGLKNLSDNDVLETIFASKTSADDIVEVNQELRERGLLSRREYREGINQNIARLSPFEGYRREIKIIESLIISKERILTQKAEALPRISGENNGIKVTAIPKQFDQLIQEARTNVARSPEEKVHRIHTRLSNILQGPIQQRHIDEIGIMQDKIRNIELPNESEAAELKNIVTQLVDEILEVGVDTIEEKSELSKVVSKESNLVVMLSPENNQSIEYLRDIRAKVLTYKLSSRRGGESVGDGNFIAHVWRPFLALFESGLKSGKIDTQSFSWKEVVDNIYATHDGIKGRVRLQAFLDMLGSIINPNGDLLQNWTVLIGIIQEFSMNTSFYRKGDGVVPLSNFLEALKNNPPPSR